MKPGLSIIIGVLILSQTTAQSKKFILQNINVVDVIKGKIIPGQTVVIAGQRIENIVPASAYSVSMNDSIINGTGKYLIPGLWDMHTHVWTADYFFPLFIANGITGFRDMFGEVDSFRSWKKELVTGAKLIPDFFYSGPIVDGAKPVWPGSIAVANAEQGRKAVDSIKYQLKTDFVKVYSLLSREAYFAIADECKKQQIDFAGHVPMVVTALEAARAGQKSQEHLYGMVELVSDSADVYFNLIRNYTYPFLLKHESTDSVLRERIIRRTMLVRSFNPKKLERIAKEISVTGTWICPTLNTNYNIANLDDSSLAKDARMKYVDSFLKSFWNPKHDFRFKAEPPGYYELGRKEFEKKLIITTALHKAGIRFLAGTDTPNPYCFPGFSLHDELQWFVKTGFSPAEALQTATINPAIYFSIQKDYGTVEKGKIASLVLLNRNPLEDIRNTKDIYMVILRGRPIPSEELKNLLNNVRILVGN